MMYRKIQILLTAVTACSVMLCGCSLVTLNYETLIRFRNGEQNNSSFQLDGMLYYAGNDGIYDQENCLVLQTESKPLLLHCGESIFAVDGTTITEYDTAFQKQSEWGLSEHPFAFAVSENSIFYTDATHAPHVTDKQTDQEIPESKPEATVPVYLEQESIRVQYYPDFTVLTDPVGGITAFDVHDPNVCVADLQPYSTPILSVSDARLLYGTKRRLTTMRLISYPFSHPEQEQVVKPEGYTSDLEQFLCGTNEIVITGSEDEGLHFPPEDLRSHMSDCYCKIDPKDMHIICQYATKRFDRILYADAEHFVVLHGDELRTFSAANQKKTYTQKTTLFQEGGDFTIETRLGTIYVFDNESNRIVGIFSVLDS